MNSDGDDLPPERPTGDRHLANLLSDVSDLVDQTVTRITHADVEEQLGRVLGLGKASPAPDQDSRNASGSRQQKLGGAHQGAAVPAAPVREPLKVGTRGASVPERGPGGPTVLRILLGTQLRRLREARGVTAQEAAQAIRGPESKISRIELGRAAVREVDIIDLLSLYGITDPAEREELLTLAGQANQPGWWHQYQDLLPSWFQAYIGLEEWTESIRSYDSQFIPGLLQTDDYATAVLALGDFSWDEAERLVLLRKERQLRFASGRPRLWAIVDELALTRPVGSRETMRAQLEYLSGICEEQGFTLQVLPDSAGAYLAPGSFSILRFAGPDLPDVVYVEQLTSAMYLDKPVDVDGYATVIDKLSAAAAPPEESRERIRTLLKDLE
jgi:transcriptional regulator with XRE-family HTH domain